MSPLGSKPMKVSTDSISSTSPVSIASSTAVVSGVRSITATVSTPPEV